MRQSAPTSGTKVESIRRRRDLLETRGELDGVRRKLARAERALASLSRILSLIPEPIEVVSADYTILFANRASRLLHENEQLEGTFYFESVMGLEQPPDQCPIRRAIDDDREAAYTAACDNGDAYEVAVTPVVLSNGSRAAMCYSKPIVAGVPREEPAGEDEEKQVLQKIAEMSAGTLDAVLAQIGDGVLLADSKGEPILFNEAFRELAGYDGSGDRSLHGILFPDRAPHTSLAAALKDLAAPGGTESFETRIVRTGGSTIPVAMAVSRIPGREGEDTVFLVTLRDLSEARELQDRLVKALTLSRAGERTANLARQINHHLTPAVYQAHELVQGGGLDPRTQQSVDVIRHHLNLCHESVLMMLSLTQPPQADRVVPGGESSDSEPADDTAG